MAVWSSKEELEEMLEIIEKEMPDFEEAKQRRWKRSLLYGFLYG